MLEIIQLYFSRVLAGRLSKLLSIELFVALAVSAAAVAAKYAPSGQLASVEIPVSEFTKLLGTYGALGMGTCLTTLALAARWTSGDFIDFFRTTAANRDRLASYTDLLFRLSWAAISHWLALLFGLLGSLFIPRPWLLIPRSEDPIVASWCGPAVIFVFAYCVMSFLSVLLGVSALCVMRKEFMDGSSRKNE
jgi:hypothetical protein